MAVMEKRRLMGSPLYKFTFPALGLLTIIFGSIETVVLPVEMGDMRSVPLRASPPSDVMIVFPLSVSVFVSV